MKTTPPKRPRYLIIVDAVNGVLAEHSNKRACLAHLAALRRFGVGVHALELRDRRAA